ncbi:hypothetical protein MNB_SV-6-698 [hydrothermal vent metagenome]|uniref:Prepilin-type N-terminal cleavage/methylation domain-containing protein n=1 Tax=hydrothermal vent metagenome TaxID=652676 RepID=A0A1W1BU99_9ZZZZ
MRQRSLTKVANSRAFTLLELLIVILIISFAYMLVFASMKTTQEKPKALQISNIKSTLAKQGYDHIDMELFCLAKSSSCYIYRDGDNEKYEEEVSLGKLSAYRLDERNDLQKIDFGRIDDHQVSLRFKLYHNGSSSQLILKNATGVYYLPPFFGEPVKTDSIESAKELWLANREYLRDTGEYY